MADLSWSCGGEFLALVCSTEVKVLDGRWEIELDYIKLTKRAGNANVSNVITGSSSKSDLARTHVS